MRNLSQLTETRPTLKDKLGPDTGNTSMPAHNDDTEVIKSDQGFSSVGAHSDTVTNNESDGKRVRPANNIDLANLDESMLMGLPYIQAKSFDVASMLDVKPRDPAYRFRWVNFKNNEGGNYDMFKSVGFENATVDDIDQKRTPLGDSIKKQDGTLKYYDVILMKISTIRLMSCYKANIQESLERVGRFNEKAKKEAQRMFREDVGDDILNELKKHGHNVEFYVHTKEDEDRDNRNASRHNASVGSL
jgi:hypothetical protein